MAFGQTLLNPATPSFRPIHTTSAQHDDMPPTPPPELCGDEKLEDVSATDPKVPEWALIDESEHLRVGALSLDKQSTKDVWAAKLREFVGIVAPGCDLGTDTKEPWKPLAVRQMPSALQPEFPGNETLFNVNLIHNEFRGKLWSPGFFFIQPEDRRADLNVTAYWILDPPMDPYLPSEPGQHGAKLVPFFNDTHSQSCTAPVEEDYMNAPVFICKKAKGHYRYFGHYSQTRFSDKLDYERMIDGTVPPFVLDVWAKTLIINTSLPWMKDALREHLWPRPTYQGPRPLDLGSGSPSPDGSRSPSEDVPREHERRAQQALETYTEELKTWEVDSKLKLTMLTEKDIHDLFQAADADRLSGLRLWWEYLQCTTYEREFYERMALSQRDEKFRRGYADLVHARKAAGWSYQPVQKTAGSGHTYMGEELLPPPSRASRTRKDSVAGSKVARENKSPSHKSSTPPQKAAGTSKSASPKSTEKASTSQQKSCTPSVTKTSTLSQEKSTTPTQKTTCVPPHLKYKQITQEDKTTSSPPKKSLPPHLRGNAAAKTTQTESPITPPHPTSVQVPQVATTSASPTKKSVPPHLRTTSASQNDKTPISPPKMTVPPHLRGRTLARKSDDTATMNETEKPKEIETPGQTKPFANGDLEAAKQFAARSTKAGPRRSGGPKTAASAVQAYDPSWPADEVESTPLGRRWAEAARNPKIIHINSQPDALW